MVIIIIGLRGNGYWYKISLLWKHIITRKHVESIFRKQLNHQRDKNPADEISTFKIPSDSETFHYIGKGRQGDM